MSASVSGSGSRPKVNLRSTAVKRIMQEASELANPSEDDFIAAPLETDIFEWHCTMRGVAGSEFEGGLYHLRILLPPTYPMSAPDIILLTPNGRFELGKKICIDGLTSFHAGSWQPAWGVRTAVLGLRSFWMQSGEALSAIGALDYPKDERKRLAQASHEWECPQCGKMKDQIPIPIPAVSESQPQPPPLETVPVQPVTEVPSSSTPTPIPDLVRAPPVPATLVDNTPPDTLTTEQPHAHDPTGLRQTPTTPTIAHRHQPPDSVRPTSRPRQAPIWIDGLIVAGVAILVMLLYRKISNPSSLIETVSL